MVKRTKKPAPQPATWSERIDQFIEHLIEREKSELTQRAYREDLTAFATWHQTEYFVAPVLHKLSHRELLAWKSSLRKRDLKPQSVNRRLAAIGSFLRWAERRQFVQALDRPRNVREEAPKPRWLQRKDELALLREVEAAKNPRDETIVKLFLACGFRVSELTTLTWKQFTVSPRKGVVQIEGKGRKKRSIPVHSEARAALSAFEASERGKKDPPLWKTAERLFHGQRGPLTIRGVQNIIERYGHEAELEDLSPHVLRHTWCRRLCERGVRLEVIGSLAGHESLETTRRYIESSEEDMIKAVESLVEAE